MIPSHEFLRCSPFSNKELKGENAICVRFANFLREKTMNGTCHAVWFHPQNESNQKVGKSITFWNLQRNIGKFAGVSDYIFLMENSCVALEIKNGKKGKLTESQKEFRRWCENKKVNYRVAHSYEEAVSITYELKIVSDD